MADEKKTILLEFEVDVSQSIESINDLTAANKALRKERNELNIASAEGRKRADEINKVIDQNTAKIKTNVSAIEQQKINIGNYKSALDGVHPALGKLGSGLEGGTAGFKAMTMQALAFIATPIGAIIAALVVAFKALQTFVQNSAVGMDKFEDVSAAVSAVVDVLVDRVVKLVGAIGKLLSGDISGGLKGMQESFSGIGDEIQREIELSVGLAKAIRELEDREIDYGIAVSESENAIKRLILQSKNRSLTEAERIKKLDEAAAIEKKNAEENLAIQTEALRIANDQANKRIELTRLAGETEVEFGKRIVKAFADGKAQNDELRDAVVEGIKKRNTAEGESLNVLEAIQNKKDALFEKQQAQREKELAAIQKQAEAEFKASEDARLQRIKSLEQDQQKETEGLTTQFKIRLDLNQSLLDQIAAQNKEARDKEAKDHAASIKIHEIQERNKLIIAANVADGIASISKQHTLAFKVAASAAALIDTYGAANAALKTGSEISPIYGFLAAAAATLKGLSNVARINGVEFAEGGWTGPGGKYQVAGVVHADEYVTPKHIVNNPAAQPHINALERMRTGMTPYFDGGLVARNISGPINQGFDVLNIVKNMPPAQVAVVDINRGQKAVAVKEKISKR